MAISSQVLSVSLPAAVALATVAIAACVPSHSLQQVEASNPSVTYEYHGDQDLFQAQQNAVTFCNQYRSAPRAARMIRTCRRQRRLSRRSIPISPTTIGRTRNCWTRRVPRPTA